MVRFYFKVAVVLGVCLLGSFGVEANDRGHQQCVCDEAGLVGSAYGACNRYCEALDCDAVNPNGSANACNKALDRFFDLTGELPPCEPVCPCATGWMNPEFVPEGEVSASCYIEISDIGKFIDFSVVGAPDGTGFAPASFGTTDFVDDEEGRFHRVGCFSERYESPGSGPSEDSGFFQMESGFAEEGLRVKRQQRQIFKSCTSILKRLVKKTGAECEVVDFRTED